MNDEILPGQAGYKGPTFTLRNRLRRIAWRITWLTLASWTPPFMHEWRSVLLRSFGARIGKGVHVYPSVSIWAPWNLIIDDAAGIGPKTQLYSMAPIHIGKRVVISQGAHICAGTHDYRLENFPLIARPIFIKDRAWICASAFVGPGVTVGEGAILSAMGCSFKDLDPWGIYIGNPAIKSKIRKILI
jgi:putative colanic acid biosynthesis acetyltransferase WcaF